MVGTHSLNFDAHGSLIVIAIKAHSVIDGDTLRVEIVAPQHWEPHLGPARQSQTGEVWIRLLGLDAPETHFPQSPIDLRHQVPAHGQYATACLSRAIGIAASLDDGEVQLIATTTPRPSLTDRSLIYLLAEHQGLDRFGRVLAFVWKTQERLGLFDDFNWMAQKKIAQRTIETSVNYALLAEGAAYPDFHSSMGAERIACLRTAVKQAQRDCLGVWAVDQTRSGVMLSHASDLAHTTLILPRLYRRIANFLQGTRHQTHSEMNLREGFRAFLGERDQAIRIRSNNHTVLFSELLSWTAPKLGLQASCEELEWH
jgi:hypothetical protein